MTKPYLNANSFQRGIPAPNSTESSLVKFQKIVFNNKFQLMLQTTKCNSLTGVSTYLSPALHFNIIKYFYGLQFISAFQCVIFYSNCK